MHSDHTWLNGGTTYPPAALEDAGPVARGLLEGVVAPTRFFYWFSTDGSVDHLVDPTGREFVRFGSNRSDRFVCLALDNLSVLDIRPNDLTVRSLINSDFNKFLDFMATLEARYPYYTDEDEIETMIEASRALREELAEIDSDALAPGTYWSDFLSDVANGDYAVSVDD